MEDFRRRLAASVESGRPLAEVERAREKIERARKAKKLENDILHARAELWREKLRAREESQRALASRLEEGSAAKIGGGAVVAGVEEEKGEEATRLALGTTRRADKAVSATAPVVPAAAVVVAPPHPAGLPPLPDKGAAARDK